MSDETGRSGYHHGDLRSALVEGARSLIEERGVEGLSLREVARRAGVSRTAPYHHFKNKAAMAAAVAQSGFERLSSDMRDAMERGQDPRSRLEECGRAYIGFALDNPTLYRLMFGSKIGAFESHPGLHTSAKCAFGLLVEGLSEVDPDVDDPKDRAMAVWAAVHGMASLLIDNLGPHDATSPGHADRWVSSAIDLIWSGVGGPEASADGS